MFCTQRLRLVSHSLSLFVLLTVLQVTNAAIFHGIDNLPAEYSFASGLGISGDGETIIGLARLRSGGFSDGYRWSSEKGFEVLGGLLANDASLDGGIVVGIDDTGATQQPVVWNEIGEMNVLSERGSASGISRDGAFVVGHGVLFPNGGRHAMRWNQESHAEPLGTLDGRRFSAAWDVSADGSIVVGQSCNPDPCAPFRWTAETGMVGLGEFGKDEIMDSRAYGISGDGNVVVGRGFNEEGLMEAWRWTTADGMQGLGYIPDEGMHESSGGQASWDGSTIVGNIGSDFTGYLGAFLWTQEDGMRRLSNVLIKDFNLGPQLEGWRLETVGGISDDGLTIVGTGINPQRVRESWIVHLDRRAVPEPSALALLAVASLGAIWWRRPVNELKRFC